MDYGHMRLWNMAKVHFCGLNTYVWSVRMIQDTKMSMISPPKTQIVPDYNLTHMRPQNISTTAPAGNFEIYKIVKNHVGPNRGPKGAPSGAEPAAKKTHLRIEI